ncbi:hypothetical protein GG804_20095 [Sphingomonas histidinilytica]|jgi:hypothetical protein|uniref:hypothetical protein n=1 Tax=Rhizorhabdus histidinilytica TaxID=439228 RepID=UPI000F770F23|nr:hypothetical protein [Rhizorhabdus histidinilytica]MBO9379076.1 hypothetical protein [Rhizorhabdus histidinilytica]QEH78991.1 hypothetical protein EIK56_12835 [Sphingomonas sp. C8-2]
MRLVKSCTIFFIDIFGRFRKLLDPPPYIISWDDTGITLQEMIFYYYRRKGFISWEAITAISSQKVDKWTYEENYLIFADESKKCLSIGELDKGFRDCEKEVLRRYTDIDEHWMAELEINPAGMTFPLWPRMKSAPKPRRKMTRKPRYAGRRAMISPISTGI